MRAATDGPGGRMPMPHGSVLSVEGRVTGAPFPACWAIVGIESMSARPTVLAAAPVEHPAGFSLPIGSPPPAMTPPEIQFQATPG